MMPTGKSSKSGFDVPRPRIVPLPACRLRWACRRRAASARALARRARPPPRPATTICTSCMRHVRLAARIAAPRLRGVVGRDVPAAHGQVDAAAIRDVVVDDDELLVMRRADGQVTVEQDLDALRFARAEDPARKELAVHRVEDRVVPQQDLDRRAAGGASAASAAACRARSARRRSAASAPSSRVRLCSSQPRMKIGALRGEQRSAQRFEIARGVDENGGARGVRAPPTGIALDQQLGCALGCSARSERSRSATPP